MSLFHKEKSVHFWGTGKDEEGFSLPDLKTQLERDYSEVSDIKLTMKEHRILATEHSGVLVANWQVLFRMNNSDTLHDLTVRTTLYGEQSTNRWLLRHAHWSLAYGEQPEGHSFPTGNN